jgi:hypothetical protein
MPVPKIISKTQTLINRDRQDIQDKNKNQKTGGLLLSVVDNIANYLEKDFTLLL